MWGCLWRSPLRAKALRSRASISMPRVSGSWRADRIARAKWRQPDLKHPSLKFTRDADGLRASDFFIVTVPTPIDEARQPDLRAMFEASRLVGAALKKGDIVVYEFDRLSRRGRRGMRADPGAMFGAQGWHGFQRRLFAGAHQSRRQAASPRIDHESGFGAKSGDARHHCRRLRVGGESRHSSRAFDQGRRSGQGDRKHPARSQHRLHERIVADLSGARDRHRRCAGCRADEMEFPAVSAGSRRRALHRGRSRIT